MFSTLMQEVKTNFSRSYILGSFFPILFFSGASLALFFEITSGLKTSLATWEALPGVTQAIILFAGLTGVIVLSYIIFNLRNNITRLFEGYWLNIPILSRLYDRRCNFHRIYWNYLQQLAEQARLEGNDHLEERIRIRQLAYYPPPNHTSLIMPTLLGNVLRAGEIYALDRYGIDSPIIWSRLRPLLKPEAIGGLEETKTTLDFMLLMTLLSAAFSLIWCPLVGIYTRRWLLFFVCSIGWPLAWITYNNAIQSALLFSEQIKVIFDLYRKDLLTTLGKPIPSSLSDEQLIWKRLGRFFYRNLPPPEYQVYPEKPTGWERLSDSLAEWAETIRPKKP